MQTPGGFFLCIQPIIIQIALTVLMPLFPIMHENLAANKKIFSFTLGFQSVKALEETHFES